MVSGRLLDPEHAAEADPAELDSLLRHSGGPDAAVLAERAATRYGWRRCPRRSLGLPEEPPPLDAFPAPLARATKALMTMLYADMTAQQSDLHGTGIGDHTYCGRGLRGA